MSKVFSIFVACLPSMPLVGRYFQEILPKASETLSVGTPSPPAPTEIDETSTPERVYVM